jgi:hypothetical protein
VSTSAVVVTWEGGEATRRCVASLLAQRRPPATIVVVDNASGTGERDALRRAWPNEPRVHVLFLDENRQFAGGMNAGAEWALARGATKLLFLNNDTVLEPDALERLEDALDAATGAGIAGPRVVDLRDPTHVITAGERHSLPLLCLPRTWLRYRGPLDRPYPVQGVMGCILLVTRACFEAVGGFRPTSRSTTRTSTSVSARARPASAPSSSRARSSCTTASRLRGRPDAVGGLSEGAQSLAARPPPRIVVDVAGVRADVRRDDRLRARSSMRSAGASTSCARSDAARSPACASRSAARRRPRAPRGRSPDDADRHRRPARHRRRPRDVRAELARALARLGGQGGHDYVVFTDRPDAFDGAGVETVSVPLPTTYHQVVWDHAALPGLLRRHGVALYHGTKGIRPVRCPVPAVVTVTTSPCTRFRRRSRSRSAGTSASACRRASPGPRA